MLVKGEVKCLSCGFVSGTWVGERGGPLTVAGLLGGPPASVDSNALVRCLRCQGSVYLEGLAAVRSASRVRRIERLRQQLAAFDVRQGAA